MTGFTFGQADDALEGIVWTECVLGRGIGLLRLADQQRTAKGWPSCSARFEPGSAHIDLTGCPAYAFAARLADLAQAMAADPEAKRLGAVEASGAFGGWIAPYVAYRLARAGNSALVYWRPSTRPAREDAPATLVMATPALDGKVSACLIAPGSEYRAATRATTHGCPGKLFGKHSPGRGPEPSNKHIGDRGGARRWSRHRLRNGLRDPQRADVTPILSGDTRRERAVTHRH